MSPTIRAVVFAPMPRPSRPYAASLRESAFADLLRLLFHAATITPALIFTSAEASRRAQRASAGSASARVVYIAPPAPSLRLSSWPRRVAFTRLLIRAVALFRSFPARVEAGSAMSLCFPPDICRSILHCCSVSFCRNDLVVMRGTVKGRAAVKHGRGSAGAPELY